MVIVGWGWCGRSLAGVCGVVAFLATLSLLEENCGWRKHYLEVLGEGFEAR